MKLAVIKVIKRNSIGDVEQETSVKSRPHRSTVTSTVTEWIALNRINRLDQDTASRKTIAAWTEGANI